MKNKKLYEIAAIIRRDWKKVNYAARPYLDAMHGLSAVSDAYGYDSGEGIVARFLENAGTWRGEVAREVKAELKSRLR